MFGAVLQMTAQLLTALNIERSGGANEVQNHTAEEK